MGQIVLVTDLISQPQDVRRTGLCAGNHNACSDLIFNPDCGAFKIDQVELGHAVLICRHL